MRHCSCAAPLESPLLGPRLLAWLARGALVLVLFAMTRPLVRNPWWAMLPGLVLLACAALAGYLIYWSLSRRGWETLSGIDAEGVPAHDSD